VISQIDKLNYDIQEFMRFDLKNEANNANEKIKKIKNEFYG
jgi:hypothetical protein